MIKWPSEEEERKNNDIENAKNSIIKNFFPNAAKDVLLEISKYISFHDLVAIRSVSQGIRDEIDEYFRLHLCNSIISLYLSDRIYKNYSTTIYIYRLSCKTINSKNTIRLGLTESLEIRKLFSDDKEECKQIDILFREMLKVENDQKIIKYINKSLAYNKS